MPSQYQPKRAQNRPRRHNPLPLLAAAAAVCLGLILIPSLGRAPEESTAAASPPAAGSAPASGAHSPPDSRTHAGAHAGAHTHAGADPGGL